MPNYILRDTNGERGPFTPSQVKKMWDNGQLTSNTEFKTEGGSTWYKLALIMEATDEAPAFNTTTKKDQNNQKEINSKENKKRNPLILISLLLFLLVIFLTNFHIITGTSKSLRIVMRDSMSFSEFTIDVNEITGMPWIAAKSRFPIGCKILQREGLIESDEEFRKRSQDEALKRYDKTLKEIEEKYKSSR